MTGVPGNSSGDSQVADEDEYDEIGRLLSVFFFQVLIKNTLETISWESQDIEVLGIRIDRLRWVISQCFEDGAIHRCEAGG
jgi:hypothetical protein